MSSFPDGQLACISCQPTNAGTSICALHYPAAALWTRTSVPVLVRKCHSIKIPLLWLQQVKVTGIQSQKSIPNLGKVSTKSETPVNRPQFPAGIKPHTVNRNNVCILYMSVTQRRQNCHPVMSVSLSVCVCVCHRTSGWFYNSKCATREVKLLIS